MSDDECTMCGDTGEIHMTTAGGTMTVGCPACIDAAHAITIARLTAERDEAQTETARWQNDANEIEQECLAERDAALAQMESLRAWAMHGGDEAKWPPGKTVVEGIIAYAEKAEAEVARLREALIGMCEQYLSIRDGKLHHDFMSAGENAFDVLGWPDTGHPVPAMTCDEPGCGNGSACGFNTPTGYRRTCGEHYRAYLATPQPENRDA